MGAAFLGVSDNMKIIPLVFTILLLSISGYADESTDKLADLLDRVASLKIERRGYVLGRALTGIQKETARRNPVAIDNPRLMKFRDHDLYIVAEKATGSVIIMYEQYDNATRKRIREITGNLFLDFGEPTVFSHDKIIYWAWGANGLFSGDAFQTAKDNQTPLSILATVKLNSSLEIMGAGDDNERGRVYYIVSSDPILKRIQPR
jgi:hypothetical protein